jgi:hypothetical protein
MGIEVSTYISGLTASWPPSGDPKSQGDDHLRLIKGVLQSTFPTASKAYYFPKGEAASTTTVLDATDQNNVLFMTTTGGDVAVTLPTGLVSADAGWSCEIMKVSVDINGVMVSPTSGQIVSQVGPTNTIRVGAYCQAARFTWTGASWICSKPGSLIGATANFNGNGVPRGYLALDGSAYNTTTFAELFAMIATGTLFDTRGRVELGAGTGGGLANRVFGTLIGSETTSLATGHLPPYTPSGTIGNGAISISHNASNNTPTTLSVVQPGGSGGGYSPATITASQAASSFSGNAQGGISQPFNIVQSAVVIQKIIRAC